MLDKEIEDLEALILDALAETSRISVSTLAQDIDSTAEVLQLPLARLKNDDKIALVGEDVVLTLSAKERQDFKRLDGKFEKAQRESIFALREIRERKLYREDHASFDDYMAARGRTRQWATQQINWLRAVEMLEAHGKASYHLSVDDAQPLGRLKEYPDEFVRAVIEAEEEAKAVGKEPTKEMIRRAVSRQQRYVDRLNKLGVTGLTYNESRLLDQIAEAKRCDHDLVGQSLVESKESGKPLRDLLLARCENEMALPTEPQLLTAARGDDLAHIVDGLTGLAKKWKAADALKKQEQDLQMKLSTVQRTLCDVPHTEGQEGDGATTSAPTLFVAVKEQAEKAHAPSYKVEFKGTFACWVKDEFGMEGEGDGLVGHDALIGMFTFFVDTLKSGAAISSESVIAVRPLAQE